MIRINLLPVKAAQKKEKIRGQLIIGASSLAFTGVGCALIYLSLLGSIKGQQEEVEAKQAEMLQLRKAIGEVGQFKKMQTELQGKIKVLADLKKARSGPVKMLEDLSQALPEKVWLTAFKENGGSISISGIGLNEEAIAHLLRNIDSSPSYKAVELTVVEQMVHEGQKLHKFEVTCQSESFVPPVAPPEEKK